MGASERDIATPSTLVDALRNHARTRATHPALTFLRDGEELAERISYAELDLRARAMAKQILESCNPGDRALLLFESNAEFVIAFLGCLYAQVIAVPAYPPRSNHHLSRLQGLVQDCTAATVLMAPSIQEHWGERAKELLPALESARWHALVDDPAQREALAAAWKHPALTAEHLAFLQYTSGSTGAPKGVMVSHGNLIMNERSIAAAFGHSETSTLVGWLPLFHDMGLIGNILQPLSLGASAVLMTPTAFIQRPVRWLRAISEHGGDNCTAGAPNFAYELCARKIADRDMQGVDLSRWRVAYNGAEPVRADVLDAFAERFAPWGFRKTSLYPCYGMAEATLFISGNPRGTEPVVADVEAAALEKGQYRPAIPGKPARRLVSCGKVWFDEQVRIVEPTTCAPCADGEVGEIWLSGPSVAQGYWQKEELTRQVFAAELAGSDRRYLRTGDLGFTQGDQLYVTGRRKDLIIIRGRNHYPQDLEATCAGASEALRSDGAAAFSVEGATGEELVLVQEVARVHRHTLDGEAVVSKIRQAIWEAHEVAVQAVVLIDQAHLPKTSSGKTQRSACRAAFLGGTFKVLYQWRAPLADESDTPTPAAAPDSGPPSAEAIAGWLSSKLAARLGLPATEVKRGEPLASYGMDSALAVNLIDEVGTWAGVLLDPAMFWDFPTIEQFSAAVAELAQNQR